MRPNEHGGRRRCIEAVVSTMMVAWAGGCAETVARRFPIAPLAVVTLPDGGTTRDYDVTGDGKADYRERLSPEGRVVALGYDRTGDGVIDEEVAREPATEPRRRLLLILDSVPFEMVHDAYARGRFRWFCPPAAIVSPFPVMTDLAIDEFYGISPVAGVESEYFDGRHLVEGWGPYRGEANSPWLADVDYYMPYIHHADVYLKPEPNFDRELDALQRALDEAGDRDLTAYFVTTSALGMKLGRDAHQAALVQVDRFCQALMRRARGNLEITLMSDHGHRILPSRRRDLDHALTRMGYRMTTSLTGPCDVVVAKFGLVSCAGLHTRVPATVAQDMIGVEGVELAMYRDGDGDIVVLSRDGRARITRRDERYRYVAEFGDPLQLTSILADLADRGAVPVDGFIEDEALFAATAEHTYPDPLYRIHRAFNGLVQHPPDVLLSLEDGACWGSPFLAAFIDPLATHGNLRLESSTGFVMTTVAPLPPRMRMIDVRAALTTAGAMPRRLK